MHTAFMNRVSGCDRQVEKHPGPNQASCVLLLACLWQMQPTVPVSYTMNGRERGEGLAYRSRKILSTRKKLWERCNHAESTVRSNTRYKRHQSRDQNVRSQTVVPHNAKRATYTSRQKITLHMTDFTVGLPCANTCTSIGKINQGIV